MSALDLDKEFIGWEFRQFQGYLNLTLKLFSEELLRLEDEEETELSLLGEDEYQDTIHGRYDDQFFEVAISYQNYLLQGFLFTWYSYVEQTLLDFCEKLKIEITFGPKDKMQMNKGIDKARTFLKEGRNYSIDEVSWNELTKIRDLRNKLVHNGDRINVSLLLPDYKHIVVQMDVIDVHAPLSNSFYIYLDKWELLNKTQFWFDIRITFEYCEHLINFGRELLIGVYEDLKIFSSS